MVVPRLPNTTCRQGTWVKGTKRYNAEMPPHNSTNSSASNASFMVGLWLRNEPPDHKITEAMVTNPAATNIGPSVSAAQYSNKR